MDNHNQQHPVSLYKRPQHNLKLANMLGNMLQCGSLTDVTIYCDDGEVNAHKLVLAASSNYFRNLFTRISNAFQYPIIVLREIPANDLRTILAFIYDGEIHIPQNRVESLLRCANYLQIDGMASSTNALNAVLATSSMSSNPMLMPAVSIISNQNVGSLGTLPNTGNNPARFNQQYVAATNCASNNNNITSPIKQSPRAHSSRHSFQNQSSHNNTTTTNTNNTNTTTTKNGSTTNNSTKPRHGCTICYKTFTHGFTLKRHIKALHSERRTTYRCDVCNKDYSCKDSFLRHKRSSNHIQHTEFTTRNIGT